MVAYDTVTGKSLAHLDVCWISMYLHTNRPTFFFLSELFYLHRSICHANNQPTMALEENLFFLSFPDFDFLGH